jgi:vacuolar-type H+-ATPase subunit H
MDTNVSQLLTDARNYQEQIRKNAEQTLEKLATTNFYDFLFKLTSELADESKLKENRQLAATIIKNWITIPQTLKEEWLNMSSDKTDAIKNGILGSLASVVKEVRRGAGLTIAGIFLIIFRNM